MALLFRPLRQWPRLHHHCVSLTPSIHQLHHLSSSSVLLLPSESRSVRELLAAARVPSARRDIHSRSGGLRFPNAPAPYELREDDSSDSDADAPKSRNQKKRDARRFVRWGMELASFSTSQIKRILRMASLEQEVFEAIMLVKRLGPDVREGKRRQFNYIGKLLRVAEPELMDALIQATKDGDQSRLQALAGPEVLVDEDVSEVDSEEEEEEEEEDSDEYVSTATRWCDGLVSRDVKVTNEVYSLQIIDFDRQELRKLVRQIQLVQERQSTTVADKGEASPELTGSRKSLIRFLLTLAKEVPGTDT